MQRKGASERLVHVLLSVSEADSQVVNSNEFTSSGPVCDEHQML